MAGFAALGNIRGAGGAALISSCFNETMYSAHAPQERSRHFSKQSFRLILDNHSAHISKETRAYGRNVRPLDLGELY